MSSNTLLDIFPPSVNHPLTGLTRARASGGINLVLDTIPSSVLFSLFGLAVVGVNAASSNILHLPPWLVPTILAAGVLSFPIRSTLISLGFQHNPYAARGVPGMVRAVIPVHPASGPTGEKASDPPTAELSATPPTGSPEFAIVHLYARSNSPFGIFTSEFGEIGQYFQGMIKDLEADRERSGLMNAESYLSTSRDRSNRLLTVFYFRSVEHVWKWTKEGLHKSAWMKLAKGYEKYPWIELGHEMFTVKASGFEGIYSNSEPHGAGALFAKDDDEGSETFGMWVPTARAMGNKDRHSKGRMTVQPSNVHRLPL